MTAYNYEEDRIVLGAKQDLLANHPEVTVLLTNMRPEKQSIIGLLVNRVAKWFLGVKKSDTTILDTDAVPQPDDLVIRAATSAKMHIVDAAGVTQFTFDPASQTLTIGGPLKIAGTQILTTQQPAIANADSFSIIIQFNQLLTELRTHGIIAT